LPFPLDDFNRFSMHHVLIVANPFRRADSSGAPRQVERWVRHLPEFGWKTTVLSSPFPPPAETRSPAVRGVFVPDSYVVRWLPRALRDGARLAREQRFDAILSTSPLDTCHLVAHGLRRRVDAPWLVDFRDPWIGNPFAPPRPAWAERLNRALERRVVPRADLVTCVSDLHRSELCARYPGITVELLPNGYDPGDLERIEPMPSPPGTVTLVHSGSFYGVRTPHLLLEALRLLGDDVRLLLLGGSTPDVEAMVEREGLAARVIATKPLPHREALAYCKGADVLVVVPGADGALPGKLFEYAAMGRPILNVGPSSSATGKLIAEWGIGASAETPEEIAHAVRTLEPVQPPDLSAYDRRTLTGRLAGLLERMCAS